MFSFNGKWAKEKMYITLILLLDYLLLKSVDYISFFLRKEADFLRISKKIITTISRTTRRRLINFTDRIKSLASVYSSAFSKRSIAMQERTKERVLLTELETLENGKALVHFHSLDPPGEQRELSARRGVCLHSHFCHC